MKSNKPAIRVIDALYKARAIFKRHRWIQRSSFSNVPTAGYCLLGAIDKAHGVSERDEDFAGHRVKGSVVVSRAIKELFPERYVEKSWFTFTPMSNECRVAEFNDNKDTTRKDALKVLDRAIELAGDHINRQYSKEK